MTMSENAKHAVLYYQSRQLLFHTQDDSPDKPGTIEGLLAWANDRAKDWLKEQLQDGNGTVNIKLVELQDDGDQPIDPIVSFRPPGYKGAEPKLRAGSWPYKQSMERPAYSSMPGMSPLRIPLLERIVSLFSKAPRAQPPPPFSLVLTSVESSRWKAFRAIPNYPAEPIPEQKKASEDEATVLKELAKLAAFLHKKRGGAPVKLRAVSLNWLVTGDRDSQPGGSGGPGGRPAPAEPKRGNEHHFVDSTGRLMSSLKGNNAQATTRTDVAVAVLDTSYSTDELQTIQRDPRWAGHEVVQQLLGRPPRVGDQIGKLWIHSGYIPANYMAGMTVDGHDYIMTDHGLFVAGIIHTLAPDATIHLYQVLNEHGLGDFFGIARALADVMDRFADKPVIINMSLTLNLPLQDEHLKDNDDFGIGRAILDERPRPFLFWSIVRVICRILKWIFGRPVLNCSGSWFDSQSVAFEWLSDLNHVLGSAPVAAAGNGGRNGNRPPANYPAAYDSVLGVGALNQAGVPARYSNLPDTPTTYGVETLGGEATETRNMQNEVFYKVQTGEGVLGVFVGEFPEDERGVRHPNKCGWAWWSGTSFATPIVTGLAAARMIDGGAASPHEAVDSVLRDRQAVSGIRQNL
jgi:hypothetical protein